MSPRRSSRARSSQQPPATNSSSSSTITLKDSRNPRNDNIPRSLSEGRSSAQRSESLDDADSMSRGDHSSSVPRRSRRGAEMEKESPVTQNPVDHDDNEVIEDDITRCVCGHADYPGPSVTIRDKYGAAAITEDMGNFFVQCDNCHVWQHGGCMGLHDESIIPDEYFCEKCRPDFHKIIKASSIGAKASRYLPVLDGSSASTPLSAADQARMKDIKNKALQNTKRRATMNSRGAYDEDEMLRQAIEESKHDGTLGKRSRDDSEERPPNKRQRTSPSNSDSSSKKSHSPEPDKPALGKNGTKLRGAAARNNREKELRERQKQETAAQRAEAASKRNARSERRRADESPPPTPSISPAKVAESKSAKGKADTPQPTKAKGKGGPRSGARGKRLGRNQYTRDLYEAADTPLRSDSRDGNGHLSPHGINGERGRSSKAKTHPARTSMNEMKKRVAAILEFVSQMQPHPSNSSKNASSHPNGSGSHSRNSNTGKGNSTPNSTQIPSSLASKLVEAVTAGLQESDSGKLMLVDASEFAKMGSAQMMETLMKELVGWQNQFGVYSR